MNESIQRIADSYVGKRFWTTIDTSHGSEIKTSSGEIEILVDVVGWTDNAGGLPIFHVLPVGGFGKMDVSAGHLYSSAKLEDFTGLGRVGVGRMAY